MVKFSMTQSGCDPCVFIGTSTELFFLALYVDDGLVFAKNNTTINKLIDHLTREFEVEVIDSGCFLGVDILHDRESSSIFLNQTRYINKILEKYNMTDCKGAKSPLEKGHSLNKPEVLKKEVVSDVPYQAVVGSINYAATGTRPDLSHTVSILSKYLNFPREDHWKAAKRVLRYLQATKDLGLLYKKAKDPSLLVYTDADWVGDQDNRRSMSGMVSFLNAGPITYKAQLQAVPALSTTEAEYVAATNAVKDILWLKRFIAEIGIKLDSKAPLLCDNQSAIRLIKNPEFHQRTKHIDIRYHFIRYVYEAGDFQVDYVETDKQRADTFTKALTVEKHFVMCSAIGLTNLEKQPK